MLILVAVTVTITKEVGLFPTARTAKQDTAYRTEEETLLTYIYGDSVYNATTGKVNLSRLKESLGANSDKWKNITLDDETNPTTLTVTGVQSGKNHIIDNKGNVDKLAKEETVAGKDKGFPKENYGLAYIAEDGGDRWGVVFTNETTYYELEHKSTNNYWRMKGPYTYSKATKEEFNEKAKENNLTFTADDFLSDIFKLRYWEDEFDCAVFTENYTVSGTGSLRTKEYLDIDKFVEATNRASYENVYWILYDEE